MHFLAKGRERRFPSGIRHRLRMVHPDGRGGPFAPCPPSQRATGVGMGSPETGQDSLILMASRSSFDILATKDSGFLLNSLRHPSQQT